MVRVKSRQSENSISTFKLALFFALLATVLCHSAHSEIITVTEVAYDTPSAADVAVSGNYAYVAEIEI